MNVWKKRAMSCFFLQRKQANIESSRLEVQTELSSVEPLLEEAQNGNDLTPSSFSHNIFLCEIRFVIVFEYLQRWRASKSRIWWKSSQWPIPRRWSNWPPNRSVFCWAKRIWSGRISAPSWSGTISSAPFSTSTRKVFRTCPRLLDGLLSFFRWFHSVTQSWFNRNF